MTEKKTLERSFTEMFITYYGLLGLLLLPPLAACYCNAESAEAKGAFSVSTLMHL